jgi:hypothetical protein
VTVANEDRIDVAELMAAHIERNAHEGLSHQNKAYLRMCLDAATRRGVDAERARIVAWLRDEAVKRPRDIVHDYSEEIADRIERGEHWTGGEGS